MSARPVPSFEYMEWAKERTPGPTYNLAQSGAAGLGAAPADAATELLSRVDWRLEALGGHGAGREALEAVLRARGDWERVTAPFLDDDEDAEDGHA